MGDLSIYSLENLSIYTLEEIKSQYIAVFNNTLMIMGYVDYTDVLNYKYGSTETYNLITSKLIAQFIEMIDYENVGIITLNTTKLRELIISFGVIVSMTESEFVQASNLIKQMLINWYNENNPIFQYPISGAEYIDKNSEDMNYIIQSSYNITYK
jgi:hypothetical protein